MEDISEEDLAQLRERIHFIDETKMCLKAECEISDNYLRRYLKTFKTVHNAFLAIIKTIKWRAEYRVDEIEKDKKLIKKFADKAQVLAHGDIVGRPIIYVAAKHHSRYHKNVDELTKYFVYCLEEASKKCHGKSFEDVCIVFDLYEFKLMNVNYPLIKNVIWLFDKHYPALLGICLIVNAPKVFAESWKVIRKWLNDETANKFVFVQSKADLSYYLIPEILPATKISTGYLPNSLVNKKDNIALEKYDWYVGNMQRSEAESKLSEEDIEGCFMVRKSSRNGAYTISVYTKLDHPHTKNYHIKTSPNGEFQLSEKHSFSTIPELINYHRDSAGGLWTRLSVTPLSYISAEVWEIDPPELVLMEEVGAGQFGVVRRGKWRQSIDVAVKVMKEGSMSENDFIMEAKVMKKLQHPNLVRLYGVCSKTRPIYIVTEYMLHGSLLNYLRKKTSAIGLDTLLCMCIQVCKGMAFLERHNYIHRDLAARNCLVKDENTVKVADFGLARYVTDDQYTSSGGTKFPLRWAPPEVIYYMRYSSKSDVWAYGVLMWEIFTYGKLPYFGLKNCEVLTVIQQGKILSKPQLCTPDLYKIMRSCWKQTPDDRPSFCTIESKLKNITIAAEMSNTENGVSVDLPSSTAAEF